MDIISPRSEKSEPLVELTGEHKQRKVDYWEKKNLLFLANKETGRKCFHGKSNVGVRVVGVVKDESHQHTHRAIFHRRKSLCVFWRNAIFPLVCRPQSTYSLNLIATNNRSSPLQLQRLYKASKTHRTLFRTKNLLFFTTHNHDEDGGICANFFRRSAVAGSYVSSEANLRKVLQLLIAAWKIQQNFSRTGKKIVCEKRFI